MVIAVFAVAAVCLFAIGAAVRGKGGKGEREKIMRRAEKICGRVKIYLHRARSNSPYTKTAEAALAEDLRRFWKFLSQCQDTRLAEEADMAMRAFISRTARIPIKTPRGKA